MILLFKKIKLVNFGSYEKAEINLQNQGICLVSGENHCIKDNAISNGSGKSTIWSAICYAITGETISGQTTNLKNINTTEEECFVELSLTVNSDNYIITRYHKPKSDLKIIKNGTDISGKGITESKKVLDQVLPDLTKDLIASTILLGQGLPNKLSSFSPSGRKELLEKLTKSDFMIEDIRTRVASRQDELNKQLKNYSDSLLVNNTKLISLNEALKANKTELDSLDLKNYETDMANLNQKIVELTENLADTGKKVTDSDSLIEQLNSQAIELANNKAQEFNNLNEAYNKSTLTLITNKTQLESEIKALRAEITRIKNIKDTCPMCKQKLPNVNKPTTELQENELAEKTTQLQEVTETLSNATQKYDSYRAEIEQQFADKINTNQTALLEQRTCAGNLKTKHSNLLNDLNAAKESLNKLSYYKENYDKRFSYLSEQIKTVEAEIKQLTNLNQLINLGSIDLQERLAVTKKMDTLIKRDFRGFLLIDIIKYIDTKAKEYCEVVFGTRELSVELVGNALEIIYCGKNFTSLSGGEQQRCDLILQFAIRDLLQTYMGYSSNILVLDEIFDNLDKLATAKIIELITEKLKDVESIFVVSHHSSELDLPIDSELNIVKNEKGISEIL